MDRSRRFCSTALVRKALRTTSFLLIGRFDPCVVAMPPPLAGRQLSDYNWTEPSDSLSNRPTPYAHDAFSERYWRPAAGLAARAGVFPTALRADGNRLTYLDANDPYYASRDLPALTTPQWIGEPGVEAVVILAIDDMRGHEKWEAYLRPDSRAAEKNRRPCAPVSIMTNEIRPDEPHLQQWLAEG